MRLAATQRGERFLQRHVTSATPIEASPETQFCAIETRSTAGPTCNDHCVAASCHRISWHPALDRAPSIFDVIGGKPIGIDNLAGAMVDHLMP